MKIEVVTLVDALSRTTTKRDKSQVILWWTVGLYLEASTKVYVKNKKIYLYRKEMRKKNLFFFL